MKIGVIWSTEMLVQANPKIPSNFDKSNEIPLRVVTYPKVAYLTYNPPKLTVSPDQYPLTAPEPYSKSNLVPLAT